MDEVVQSDATVAAEVCDTPLGKTGNAMAAGGLPLCNRGFSFGCLC